MLAPSSKAEMFTNICLLIGSYLLGALPFGLWVALKLKGVDIRTVGSGNIGSTNVGRICGPGAGAAVLILDMCKGLIPPLVGTCLKLASPWIVAAAMLAIVGHNFSVFLNFKGGKGIATSGGALLGISWPVGVVAALAMGIGVLTLRYVSVGSLLAAASLPFAMHYFYPGDSARLAFGIIACVMAFYKHRSNIQRLISGTEPKVSLRRTKRDGARPTTGQVDHPESDKSAPNAG
jgi:glycerol-3-phosphate acyltransferase PlsY